MKKSLLLCLCATVLPWAQNLAESDTPAGSLVVVRGRGAAPHPGEVHLPLTQIQRADATSADQAIKKLPGAHVFVNSRGEALVSIRGAAERQVAIYQDGVPLSLPWDQRVDLSLVPLGLVGGIEAERGAPSVLYGPWSAGGVVNLVTRRRQLEGQESELLLKGGSLGLVGADAIHLRGGQNSSISSGAGFSARGARPVADNTQGSGQPPFTLYQSSNQRRTNTDLRSAWAGIRTEFYPTEQARYGLSFSVLDGAKGEAPSGIAGDKARFWRYPNWRLVRASLDGNLDLENTDWSGSLWMVGFEQTIDQYKTATFNQKDKREDGEDLVLGGRGGFSWEQPLVLGTLDINASNQGLWTKHEIRSSDFDTAGKLKPSDWLEYQQWQNSLGLEATWHVSPVWLLEAGIALDASGTPKTGDKPSNDNLLDVGTTVSLGYEPLPGLQTWLAAGSRTRAPSLRELYGEALNKFAPNPDLKAETFHTAEFGLAAALGVVSMQGSLFYRQVEDLIDQQTLSDKRNQRINLDVTNFFGTDLSANAEVSILRLDGRLLWMKARTEDARFSKESPSGRLTRTPEVLSTVSAELTLPGQIKPLVEWQYQGRAWDRLDNKILSLGSAHLWNARLGWEPPPAWTAEAKTEVFVRLDNAFDRPYFPQMGLPAPGRTWQAGVRVSM